MKMARDDNREQFYRLKLEDRILWDKVRSTAIPLAKSEQLSVEIKDMPALFSMEIAKKARLENIIDDNSNGIKAPPQLFPFDKPTYRKISRGRVEIEGRVDLHGLYRDEAYSLLLNFLQSARHRGLRHVLVITGKGLSSAVKVFCGRPFPIGLRPHHSARLYLHLTMHREIMVEKVHFTSGCGGKRKSDCAKI